MSKLNIKLQSSHANIPMRYMLHVFHFKHYEIWCILGLKEKLSIRNKTALRPRGHKDNLKNEKKI